MNYRLILAPRPHYRSVQKHEELQALLKDGWLKMGYIGVEARKGLRLRFPDGTTFVVTEEPELCISEPVSYASQPSSNTRYPITGLLLVREAFSLEDLVE